MTGEDPISKRLSAPLPADWTIDSMAEQVLSAVAREAWAVPAEPHEIVLTADTMSDRQSRRLLRPLLACLARKSAAERGTSPDLYEGRFAFQRPGRDGPVWILGEYTNMPGRVKVTFRWSDSAPTNQEPAKRPTVFVPGQTDSAPSPSDVRS